MRHAILITVLFVIVFVALRLVGIITPGWFLGLGAVFVVFGIFILFIMAGAMEGDWQLQLGGFLFTLGIVMLIVSWFLG